MCCGEIEQLTDLVTRRAVTYIGLVAWSPNRLHGGLDDAEGQEYGIHFADRCADSNRPYFTRFRVS